MNIRSGGVYSMNEAPLAAMAVENCAVCMHSPHGTKELFVTFLFLYE